MASALALAFALGFFLTLSPGFIPVSLFRPSSAISLMASAFAFFLASKPSLSLKSLLVRISKESIWSGVKESLQLENPSPNALRPRFALFFASSDALLFATFCAGVGPSVIGFLGFFSPGTFFLPLSIPAA